MQHTFPVFNGKKISRQNLDFSRQDEKNPTRIYRNYNVEALFDYYIQGGGIPARMIEIIEGLPENKKCLFPKKAQLYIIIKKENFARRYSEIVTFLRKKREDEVGMSQEVLDKVGRNVLVRYAEGIMQDKIKVSQKDLKTIWHITRTERGLVTNISQQQVSDVTSGVKRLFEKRGVSELLEAFQSLPKKNKKNLITNLSGDDQSKPKLLNRGGSRESDTGA